MQQVFYMREKDRIAILRIHKQNANLIKRMCTLERRRREKTKHENFSCFQVVFSYFSFFSKSIKALGLRLQ